MTNTIKITHELCEADRARIDRLIATLEALQPPTLAVQAEDDIQKKLAETLAKTNDPIEPIAPTAEEAETPAPSVTQVEEAPQKPTVTLEQIQPKVIQLAAANNGAKKAKVRDIIKAYAKSVSDLPEDKLTEVWDKLIALEKED